MAFKSASSPGSYNQLIAHDDKTTRLRAAQDKDRNDQIAHNKQLADTHRQHAKSFDFAVQVEASARQNAIQFDEYVRGVNQKFELASIQAANATAIRNSQNEQIEQANNQAQLMGLVQKTIGTVSTVIDATNKAKERAELEAAQGFKQKWSLTAEGHFGLGKLTEAMWADEAKLEASQLAAKKAGMTWADIQQYLSLGSVAKTAINQNYLHGQLQQVHTLAIADDQLISNGKTFKEWSDSGLPESTSQVEFLTRRKISQIFEMASRGGYDGNPAVFDTLIEKTVASAVNSTRRNIETQAAARVVEENKEKNLAAVRTLGFDGVLESFSTLPGDQKKSVTKSFLETERILAAQGSRNQTDVELLGDAPVGTSGFTVRNHPSYAGLYLDIVKANNAYRTIDRTTDGLDLYQQTVEARDWVKKEVPNMNAEELKAVEQKLAEKGIKDRAITAMLNAAADKLPKNAVQVELQEYVKVNKAWSSIAELRRIGGDDATKYINEVYTMRNKDQWWQSQKNKFGAMAAEALGFSGEKARDQASYHTVVPMLRAQGAALMQKYRSEGMTELQAQGQVEAWIQDLDEKIDKDPFGNHILGVWDKAKNPKGEGFKIHDKVDKIVPLENVKSSDISKAIAPHIKGDVYTNREGVREYLRTNSSALNGIVSTDDAIRMLDALNTNENASRRTMNIFADVGSYTGTGYSQAAIDFLKGKGIDYKPPKNQTYEEISNKMDAAIFETVMQRHGSTAAYMIANNQAVVRGQPHTGGANYDAMVFPSGYNLRVASSHRVDPLAQAKAHGGLDYKEPRPQGHNHHGEDIAMPKGTQMIMREGGTVIESTFDSVGGNSIYIKFDDGTLDRYLHLDQRFVVSGGRVTPGMVIGTVGNTGRSYGSHLHWESYASGGLQGGDLRDPMTAGTPKFEFGVYGGKQQQLPPIKHPESLIEGALDEANMDLVPVNINDKEVSMQDVLRIAAQFEAEGDLRRRDWWLKYAEDMAAENRNKRDT